MDAPNEQRYMLSPRRKMDSPIPKRNTIVKVNSFKHTNSKRTESQTFGDILVRVLAKVVQAKKYDQFVNGLIGIGGLGVVIYSVPYTFVFKQKIVQFLSKNPTLSFVRRTKLYYLIFFLLLSSLYVEYRKQKKMELINMDKSDIEATTRPLQSPQTLNIPKLNLNSSTATNEMVQGDQTISVKTAKRTIDSVSRMNRSAMAMFLMLFLQRSQNRITGVDIDILMSVDKSIDESNMLNFKPPPLATIKLFSRAYSSILEPKFLGAENIPDPTLPQTRPLMFVSNHTIMGFDFPLLLTWLYEKKGIFIRAMADHAHFQIPGNAQVMANIVGAVDGTRRNCDLLAQAKQPIFLYPGGARETFKRTTDDKYQLFWEGKYGFCKLAVKNGCDIVPVINYGTEDMVDIVKDLPMGWLPIPFLWGSDRTLPVMLPRQLQKIYFYFGTPISTTQYDGDFENIDILEEVHQTTKRAIQDGIEKLKHVAENDPERSVTPASDLVAGASSMLAATIRQASKQMPSFVEANM